MHIPDGILPVSACLGGYAVTAATAWFSLRRINRQENPREGIPKASVMTAAFFAASLVHIPVPPTSVHLVLNGLLGVVLGYYAFPAILIGLFFQAVMFQHGGLTTLGVNAAAMGLPAILAFYLFRLRNRLKAKNKALTAIFSFIGGAGGLAVATVVLSVVLVLTIPSSMNVEAEKASILALSLAHIPLAVLEGVFTALVVLFLERVKPELLEGSGDDT